MSEASEVPIKGTEYVKVSGLPEEPRNGYYKIVTKWSDGRLLISPLPKTRAELVEAIAAFGGKPLSEEELAAECGPKGAGR